MPTPEPLAVVFDYHERTKHHPERYARALGYMDWATQPSPFRSYEGAAQLDLDHPPLLAEPTYDQLFARTDLPALPVTRDSISRLFYDSLALSAWKQAPGTKPWSLRINPSSGALQPTESYLIAGAIAGLVAEPGVYHYSAYRHALERRCVLSAPAWQKLTGKLPQPCILVALTSIYWRESWKYGERGFRYCQHDVGHAIATVTFAARTLGWRARLVESITTADLAQLIGIDTQRGSEAEHAECLLLLHPASLHAGADIELGPLPSTMDCVGKPNRLSKDHHAWPIIADVDAATAHSGGHESLEAPPALVRGEPERGLSAQALIRNRRSAVDMDGQTSLPASAFFRMLGRTLPGRHAVPFAALPWQPCTSLLLFVHRVEDVEPGMYILVRHPDHEPSLRSQLRPDAVWQRPAGSPDDLPLYLLVAGSAQRVAKLVSCHQDIAADGIFAAAMLCQFAARLESEGPSFYRRLFWETGVIGQVLYLEAEAACIRATGIGCFFDDTTHDYAGLTTHAWQDLYHFTVGGPVDDPRLKTIAPYEHLRGS